jgi:transcriptional regulator with XRE-family HTH domain
MPRLRNHLDDIERGAIVRRIRIERNLKLVYVAKMVGTSYQQIQKYETGENELSITSMKKVAAALEVDACEICGCCDES